MKPSSEQDLGYQTQRLSWKKNPTSSWTAWTVWNVLSVKFGWFKKVGCNRAGWNMPIFNRKCIFNPAPFSIAMLVYWKVCSNTFHSYHIFEFTGNRVVSSKSSSSENKLNKKYMIFWIRKYSFDMRHNRRRSISLSLSLYCWNISICHYTRLHWIHNQKHHWKTCPKTGHLDLRGFLVLITLQHHNRKLPFFRVCRNKYIGTRERESH